MRASLPVLLCVLALTACETDEGYVAPAPGQPFEHARVTTENMRVGLHASTDIRVQTQDIPGGCEYLSSAISYQGEVPPGIELHVWEPLNGGGHNPFTGTPRQAGVWQGMLLVRFQCQSGGPQYDRNIRVVFNIAP